MLSRSQATPSKTGVNPRRSLRLMRHSRSNAAAAVPFKSDSSSSSYTSASEEKRRKKRKSRLQDVTNASRKKRRSVDEDSYMTKPLEANAVTPNAATTREDIEFEKQIARQLEERMMSPTTKLPRGVVDLYPRRWTNCVCDQNHSSCSSQSHVFLNQYGYEYYKALKEWDELRHTVRPNLQNSSSSSDSDSNSNHFATRVSLTPPNGVNYAVRGSIEDQSSNDSSSVVTRQQLPHQPNLTEKMRRVLVDWLIELSEEYNISSKTLHLTVALLDRSLECGASGDEERQLVVTRDMFQCLGW